MSVTKLKSYNIVDAMKPEQMVGQAIGNNALDTLSGKSISKEPVHYFPRASDNPVQWIQLLQAFDQQGTKSASEHIVTFAQAAGKANGEPKKYLPGWPLMYPPKAPMKKCDKCTREFCSAINYRRHIRVHRRSLNLDKDFQKNRDFLGEFWDKLSADKAMEIVSLENVTLEEVSGMSLVKALASLIHKPDLVQALPSRFPISAQEFFTVLDDGSEKTFLCAGTAFSMQKFVFDGETGKIMLEVRNIVACICFLLEQNLVKAWLADKDVEALRCQKLLVEEEEAAQKRQADLFERRRLKKFRQKEQQKLKEQIYSEDADFREHSSDSLAAPPSVESSSSPAASNAESYTLEEPSDFHTNEEVDTRCFSGSDDNDTDKTSSNADSSSFQNGDPQVKTGSGRRRQIITRRPVSCSQRCATNGYHVVVTKLGPVQRQGVHRDQRSTSLTNGHKIWTRKTKPDEEGEEDLNVGMLEASSDLNARVLRNSGDQPNQSENREVLIGSISVILRECNGQTWDLQADQCAGDKELYENKNTHEKHAKSDSGHGTNRSVKLWRQVGRDDTANTGTAKNGERDADTAVSSITVTSRPSTKETSVEEGADARGLKLFCSSSAVAFLAQRWKEAVAAEHVRLVLSPECEPPKCPDKPDDTVVDSPLNPNILCSSENRLISVHPLEHATDGATKIKRKVKPRKGGRLKYMPKEKNHT
ncbi:hypothetical protein IFM89_013482 [Coptis chinensis]|uniref:C2H2-type domain-containing protein n=1 Tax=Coptis chinensis TaxID=261450 RepID=A0A835ICP8_9MAGN|nr:hypothetical protein IFM89_013482 [Coptis chinensis]